MTWGGVQLPNVHTTTAITLNSETEQTISLEIPALPAGYSLIGVVRAFTTNAAINVGNCYQDGNYFKITIRNNTSRAISGIYAYVVYLIQKTT